MKNALKADDVAAKLRELHGNMAAAARAFGVTRQAVHAFVAARPSLAAVAAECRESMKDHAESALHKAVVGGEAWAVCFYLKTQAKDRGYVERVEQTGKNGGPAEVSGKVTHDVAAELAPYAAAIADLCAGRLGYPAGGEVRPDGLAQPLDTPPAH